MALHHGLAADWSEKETVKSLSTEVTTLFKQLRIKFILLHSKLMVTPENHG